MNEHLEDWRRGSDSILTPLQRVELMNDWLKENKRDVLKKELVKQPEEIIGGFDKLPMYE